MSASLVGSEMCIRDRASFPAASPTSEDDPPSRPKAVGAASSQGDAAVGTADRAPSPRLEPTGAAASPSVQPFSPQGGVPVSPASPIAEQCLPPPFSPGM
eukprot:8654803-Alexandrium_andersonii.AAC.1